MKKIKQKKSMVIVAVIVLFVLTGCSNSIKPEVVDNSGKALDSVEESLIQALPGEDALADDENQNSADILTAETKETVIDRENRNIAGFLTAEEEKELQQEVLAAAAGCAEIYKDIPFSNPGTSSAYLKDFSGEKRKEVVECLGRQGFVSVSDDINMENYQDAEAFYEAYSSGNDAVVTIFDVQKDGNISARTFLHRSGNMQVYYVSVGWKEGGEPEIKDCGIKDLEEIKLTEKGYFIYTYTETAMHGNLREYYRVKPLTEECRELTKKYITGLSYVNYNMLVTNWDADNAEEILMPCMFEDIYRICTGEHLKTENGRIPAEVYERIMTTCFPVSAEQVRKHCGYHADTDSYAYEMACSRQFPPFGEVVDYEDNGDGTITLYVDGVWPDYNSDYAFTNRIVVQPFEDGTFRYLSNFVEAKELEVPEIEG